MHVKRIEIANFRGLSSIGADGKLQSSLALDFDSTFNVLIGVNGVGKTSILDAIAILLSRLLPRLTPALGGYRHFETSDFHIGANATTARIWLEVDGQMIDYSLHEVLKETKSITEDFDKARCRRLHNQVEGRNPLSKLNAPIALLYTTDRAGFRLPQKPKAGAVGRAAAYQGALNQKNVNYSLIVSWLRTRQALATEDADAKRILAVTESALHRFLPAFGELEVGEDPPRLYVKKRGIRLGIEQLSDGERSFLAMVVDTARHLAQANPSLADPLKDGKGVVLIDELELHLHPQWQRTVVLHLQETFPGLQFITTTHSPFVIQSLRPGQLIKIDPESYEKEFDEYADKSIEDITENILDVEMPQKSERYQQMMDAAEKYFRLLRTATPTSAEEKEALKRQLDELSIPFSDDPAYMALLKVERETMFSTLEDASN